MILKHGDLVRFVGQSDRPYFIRGETYKVFGHYPPTPMKGDARPAADEVSVYVDDPKDRFGGVLAKPANEFVPA